MNSPTQQTGDGGTFRLRGWILVAALLALLGGVLFLSTRRTVPIVEAHRSTLELRDDRWYASGQTNGFTGLLIETYEDGTMKSRSTVVQGLLEGLSEGYHTNGVKQVAEHFVAGTSHGQRTKWHPNGQVLSEVTIVNGKLEGTFRTWHDNGQPAEVLTLKGGQPDGLARAYYPSGFLKSRVTLQEGKVVDQQFWKDGEFKEAATTPGQLHPPATATASPRAGAP